MDNNDKDRFIYTYSAREREEVMRIRKKYMAEEDKMEQVRRMDAGVGQKAAAVSIMAGVIGVLIMGTGMCCVMVWKGTWFLPGIIIGIAGMAVLSAAYPVYQRVIIREREKIAPEIIRLTDELIKRG